MAKKRVTITIDKELDEKIRQLQADFIARSNKSWSYSSVLSIAIDEGMKFLNHKAKSVKEDSKKHTD